MTSTLILTLGFLSLVGHVTWAKIVLPEMFDQDENNDLFEYEDLLNNQKVSNSSYIRLYQC